MMVYDDFYGYNSQTVYQHSKDAKKVGWSSVRILGWGVDESHDPSVEYWVRNKTNT